MPLRILVADDFEPWRRFVFSVLQKADLQVALEVQDGLEAVYEAENLRPDLILLDIGLPTLNGIRAASRIRDVSPGSKILFLSEESSPEVATAALEAGGAGYVVKSDAGRELVAAINALSAGGRYVSSRLAGQVFFGALDDCAREDFTRHDLQVYPDDASFSDGFAQFVAAGLNAGNAVIAITTETHRQGLFQRLQTRGFSLDVIIKGGAYTSLDVHQTLSSFMLGDQPDPMRFWDVASSLVETASKTPNGAIRRVFGCGECAPVLWAQGKLDAALRLEELWDAACHKYGLKILCGYLSGSLRTEKECSKFPPICAVHSSVVSHNAEGQIL